MQNVNIVKIELQDSSNQCGRGMSVSLNGFEFEHTKLAIHLKSFNDEFAIVKEAQDAYPLSLDSKLTRVNLQLNSISTTPILKRILYSIS